MILIVIFAAFALTSWCDATCVSDRHVNGCSIPLNMPFPFKTLFKPVCNRHDICYYCGQRYGWTRRVCDEAFKRDMEKKCEERYANRKRFFSKIVSAIKNAVKVAGKIAQWPFIRGDLAKCKHGADIYFRSVDSFGDSSYANSSPSWCNLKCAKEAGDPRM